MTTPATPAVRPAKKTRQLTMINHNHFRSDAMYLLHEALARARMRSAPRGDSRSRPAREVMVAARRRRWS